MSEFADQPHEQQNWAPDHDFLYSRIERGLKKAKREYDRLARESGFLKPHQKECWREVEGAFEALAELREMARHEP